MPVTLKSNRVDEDVTMELEITAEADDGHVFLVFSGTNDDGEEVMDFLLERDRHIQEFFRMVDQAKAAYERQVI